MPLSNGRLHFGTVAGFKSEWRPASSRNRGRLEIGRGGRLQSEFAGHTPGSAFFTLRDGDEELIFVGDLVHSTAVQFPDPTVTIAYDLDQPTAASVRAQAFGAFARDEALIAVPHADFPGVGHVRREGEGYAWVPLNYTNREAAQQ